MHPNQGTNEPEDPDYVKDVDYEDEEEDDDDDADEPIASTSKSSSVARRIAKTKETVFSPETKGLLQFYLHQAKHVLVNPKDFFENMHTEGGLAEPAIFLGISASIYGLFEAIGHLSPLVFFQTLLSSLVFVFLGAIIVNFSFKSFGGSGNYESTVRVLAFSKATLLFAWISVANLPIGGILATGYTVYLNIIGCKKIHQQGTLTTVTVIIVLWILQLTLKKVTGW